MSKLERTIAAMRRAGERTGLDGDVAEAITRNWMMGARELLTQQIADHERKFGGVTPNTEHTANTMFRAAEDTIVAAEALLGRIRKLVREQRYQELADGFLLADRIAEDGR